MKVVFFGSSQYVIPILEVIQKNFALSLVVTSERDENEPVRSYCRKRRIPYVSVSSPGELTTNHELRTISSPFAVLAYFGLILPKAILDLFPKGILNLHPSLLPKYRGPTPVQTAILNGDSKTGVTLIRLDEQVDHGPILAQVEEPIRGDDTADSLYERLFAIGAKLLDKNINKYIKGELKQSGQGQQNASFTKRLKREDGYIDLHKPPDPKTLDLMIRAFFPWPGVWTTIPPTSHLISQRGRGNRLNIRKRLKFLKAHLEGTKLVLDRVQVEGGKTMSYKDFVNGYPEAKSVVTILSR